MKLRWKITIGVGVLILLVGGGIWWKVASSNKGPQTVSVSRRTVAQEVTFTGRLKAVQRAQMAFESSGTLQSVAVKVGDVVTAGQELARLDARGPSLELAKAKADQAAATDTAKLSWQHAQKTTEKTIAESKQTLERRRQTVRDAKNEMDQAMDVWQQAVREAGDESSATKLKYSSFLSAQSAYRAAQQAITEGEATAAKTNQSVKSAEAAAYASYLATQQASSQVAGLSSGQALQALANLRLVKSIAIAPFSGVITEVPMNAGEVAVAGSPVVTIESTDNLEVVADVPESDITKLSPGMQATFTLDAYSDTRTWAATITSIAPAAKVLEGVPTYEVTLVLTKADSAIKTGMTANVLVESAKKEHVLAVPRRAVVRTEGAYKVRVLQADKTIREQDVELGILGADGYMEITKGLTEGDVVVVSETATR